jgi:hypothetical protein
MRLDGSQLWLLDVVSGAVSRGRPAPLRGAGTRLPDEGAWRGPRLCACGATAR